MELHIAVDRICEKLDRIAKGVERLVTIAHLTEEGANLCKMENDFQQWKQEQEKVKGANDEPDKNR